MPDDALSAWLREGTARSEDADEARSSWDRPDREFSWAGDSSDGRSRRRGWRLLTLAVAPWLAVVGLVIAGWKPSQRVPTTAPPPALATTRPRAVAASHSHSTEHPTTLDSRAGPGEADALGSALGATAAAAVQLALTGTDQASARSRYVNLALPEAITWVGDVAIVDVAAVVLEGTGGNWGQPHPARYAVPLQVRAGTVRVLSVPWALPDPPQTAPRGTAFAPVNDRALAEAAGRAISSVGYRDVRVQALARDPGLPGMLKVEVTAISPGEGQPRSQEIWVSDQPSPTVLGADHSRARSDPEPQPTVASEDGAR
ncbi:MAG: hypothetical protein ACRDYX_06195 [Egibacteraceae bacterium]